MVFVYIIVGLIIFFAGVIFGKIRFGAKHIGVIRVDRSDPDDVPYLYLQLNNKDVGYITKQRYVTMKVEIKDFISQK